MKYPKLQFALASALCCGLLCGASNGQETKPNNDDSEAVFSGPQPGEILPGFSMKQVNTDKSDQAIDVVKMAGQKPLLLIFFHEKTRPAFGLMRALTQFAATKKSDDQGGLTTGVCFLTKDPTETTTWIGQIGKMLDDEILYGVYPDGIEGPGSLGLNRNVALTVLIANQGKVTFNAALVQPSLETDGQKILAAIVEATGGGEVPDIRKLAGQTRMAAQPNANAEPDMRPLLSALIQQGATNEEVDKAAAALEKRCAEDPAARAAIARISNTIVNSDKLENYGTLQAQDYLKKWAKEFGTPIQPPTDRQKMQKDKDSGK